MAKGRRGWPRPGLRLTLHDQRLYRLPALKHQRETGVRFLFLIRHALYLRNYESVVRQLARRGHAVHIVVTDAKPVDDTLLRRLPADHAEVSVSRMPQRTGWWWAANDPLRAMRDYLRYFEPAYAGAPLLAARGARRIPGPLRAAFEGLRLGRARLVRSSLQRLLRLLERATPPDPAFRQWIAAQRPDAVLVTPLIEFLYVQLDALKAAKSLGVPTALLVASWDNLTNKGLIQIEPDLVTVWNEAQRREAEAMHNVRPGRIAVTGAQLYDHWFEMTPSATREAFCARLGGLDPLKPIVLYLCSSEFICPDEVSTVRGWLKRLRDSGEPLLASANVVVRPHPMHAAQWAGVDLTAFGNVVVWPPSGAAPLDQERKQDYFDNLHHAAAVVGVNTSGFLEASIVGRRALALPSAEVSQSQEGTLHFRHLVEGGLIRMSKDMGAHLAELGEVLRGSAQVEDDVRRFVEAFLRPHGLDRPCTPIFVDTVERFAATSERVPTRAPMLAPLMRAAAVPAAIMLRRMYLSRLRQPPGYFGAVSDLGDQEERSAAVARPTRSA